MKKEILEILDFTLEIRIDKYISQTTEFIQRIMKNSYKFEYYKEYINFSLLIFLKKKKNYFQKAIFSI